MDKLLLFLNQLEKYKADAIQKTDIIEFSLKYNNKLDSLISYDNIKELNSLYPNTINLYIRNSCTEEIDLIDYVNDKSDFEDELEQLIPDTSLILIIINFRKIIRNFFNEYEKEIIIYYSDYEFLREFNVSVNYTDIENKFFNYDKNIVLIIKSDLHLFNNSY